jgi:UPF0755 protein
VKRLISALIVLLVAAAVAAAVGFFWLRARVDEPYRAYSTADQVVEIPSGQTTRAIGRRLVAAGVVRDDLTFRAAVWMTGDARRLKAGDYRFDRPMSAREVVGKIARGDVDLVAITFREGLTIVEMAGVFESSGFGPASAFVEAAQDVTLVQQIDNSASDLEGYLFPDTYTVPRRIDARTMVALMLDRFSDVLTPELRTAAEARGFSIRQLVTLASLVEKETARADERPAVAAVYVNRLKLGMAMQCDPTVIYALQRNGMYDGNLQREDLAFDSPYNTYRYPGLPPGPIAAPGQGSLEAAANPADVDFLYFVSRNDGSHEFARTLAEHNRNVQKYQIEYFRNLRNSRNAQSSRSDETP